MKRETALMLFTDLETDRVEYDNHDAPGDEWKDENTPPKATMPTYAVRLDASLNADEEREYRIRLTFHPWLDNLDASGAIEQIAHIVRQDDVQVSIQNNGIELS